MSSRIDSRGASVRWKLQIRRWTAFRLLALIAAGLSIGGQAALAAPELASPWASGPGGRVRLVAAATSHNGTPVLLAVEFDLKPGWHTYWRVPGDSGIAPKFDWAGSRNLARAEMRWPMPRRFDEMGEASYGYTGHVLLPVLARPEAAGAPLRLALALDYGVCSNICVASRAVLALDLPADGALVPSSAAPAIGAALMRVPQPPANPGDLVMEKTMLDGRPALSVRYRMPAQAAGMPVIIAVSDGDIYFDAPQGVREGGKVRYLLPVPDGGALEGRKVTVLLSGEDVAIEAERTIR
ncbi:MAG: protein-disulfide reductase DsbD family protein [Parvibaculaceae bacterium]|nr:protein-disulfide reductase DsbD family protein [Parvibaculaceae bacterium]